MRLTPMLFSLPELQLQELSASLYLFPTPMVLPTDLSSPLQGKPLRVKRCHMLRYSRNLVEVSSPGMCVLLPTHLPSDSE